MRTLRGESLLAASLSVEGCERCSTLAKEVLNFKPDQRAWSEGVDFLKKFCWLHLSQKMEIDLTADADGETNGEFITL